MLTNFATTYTFTSQTNTTSGALFYTLLVAGLIGLALEIFLIVCLAKIF